jgi:hypothetical protein
VLIGVWGTGAALLTLLFHALETSAPAAEGFLAAFRGTFCITGIVSALAGMAAALATRIRR